MPQHPNWRGKLSAGEGSRVVFFDGRTNRKVDEVPTGFAPHLMIQFIDKETLEVVRTISVMDVPAGVFSHVRARAVVLGLGSTAR